MTPKISEARMTKKQEALFARLDKMARACNRSQRQLKIYSPEWLAWETVGCGIERAMNNLNTAHSKEAN